MKTVKAWAVSINNEWAWTYGALTRRRKAEVILESCFTEDFLEQNDVRIERIEIRSVPPRERKKGRP